jgi:hypothetical protein
MCFIIERPLCQLIAVVCRDDVYFWTRMPCDGRLKSKVRILAVLAGVNEVSVLRFDSTGACTTTS